MKIRYLQMKNPINIPGQGTPPKWSNTGTEAPHKGQCKNIVQVPDGFLLELAAKPHAGIYFIPQQNVDHAGVEIDPAELVRLGMREPIPPVELTAKTIEASQGPLTKETIEDAALRARFIADAVARQVARQDIPTTP